MSKPDVWVVVSKDAPGTPHVAGVFRSYEAASQARQQLARPDKISTYRSMWQYDVWQLPLDRHIDPPPWP